MKVIIDADPDYPEFFSIWTDTGGIDAELCGKIGERSVAEHLAKALETFELPVRLAQ